MNRHYLVWFLKGGKRFSVRGVNATSAEAARAEAERRIAEGGVIGIRERGDPGEDGLGDYVFGRPGAGITIWCVVEGGEATELADRDLQTEWARREGRPPRWPSHPDIPF
ncbi:MAG: hypothetical protein K2X87_18110 [Gemmataceae bacterium]|nr:hypothetical protein [Gemmataceae bacterium]